MSHTTNVDSIEQRLRHDLLVVAETVTDTEPATSPGPIRKAKRKWRLALAVGAAVAIPVMAAAAVVHEGPEYVDTIPRSSIVMEGDVGGSSYLLVESRRSDGCGHPVTGVELVEEDENLLGSEWNTIGSEYGELVETSCGYVNDTARYLANPALFSDSGREVGDSFVWVYAVHPDVTAVRITGAGGYSKELKVYEVDGAGYSPFEVPVDLDHWTSELLVDGQVVPGSREEQHLRRP